VPPGTETGYILFQQRCMTCHGNANSAQRAPDPSALRAMTADQIMAALTTGVMKTQGDTLTEEQRRNVALAISGRPVGSLASGDAKDMPNRCASNPPLTDPAAGPAWNGWGVDLSNSRFQTAKAAGFTAEQVPNLKLKWAFGFPGGVSAYGQPTVVSGRVFVTTDIGYVYSIDAKSGCVYWSYQAQAAMRNSVTVGPVKGQGNTKYAAWFGDLKANVYAIDAQTGKQLWATKIDDDLTARSTAAPVFYNGKLFAPVSSFEEAGAAAPNYPCCRFRGAVAALDANTGKQVWKTYVIPEEPKPTKKNSLGTQLYGPAGASVFNSPTVDPKRNAIYFGTGDAETYPASPNSDAIMALDMTTGKILWVFQTLAGDSFLVGCQAGAPDRSENCPEVNGPDLDVVNPGILKSLANGKRILVAATKDGNFFGLDPDNKGAVIWKGNRADKPRSGVFWGGAADEKTGYFGLSGGGIVALQLATGEKLWFNNLGVQGGGRGTWHATATTGMPGAIFVAGGDGKLHAVAAADGHELWEFDTNREFLTVNQVPARGGAMQSAGPTVAGGMLFVGSGYGVMSNLVGNVLLAFAPE
jgi:polyvinyl alcohol dehydrogenase (cytochrome)